MPVSPTSRREYSDRIFTPGFIIQILKENDLSLKKFLGQNLLLNRDLAGRILKYSGLEPRDSVLEIGPGLGTMTLLLAEHAGDVTAVEIDRGIARYLSGIVEEFGLSHVRILEGDFLSLSPEELSRTCLPNKVVSNFPYSVAIKSIIRIAEYLRSVHLVVGTVQKELADRITAKPGMKNYSFVSVYIQFLMNTSVLEKRILPQSFFPRPEVESAVIKLTRREWEPECDPLLFKKVAKGGFSNRRKRLVKNLGSVCEGISASDLELIVGEAVGDSSVRAEHVSVDGFICLCRMLQGAMGESSR
jgi:16S rRNA (adenine1518-N6/adenine1519-N6)-dimethyltransferase